MCRFCSKSDWKYSKSNCSQGQIAHTKPSCRSMSRMRCSDACLKNETSTPLMLCDSCPTMPVLMTLASSRSDNNASSHGASVWASHVAQSQPCCRHCHVFCWFDTEMGTPVRKGGLCSCCQSKQACLRRITCFDVFFCISDQPLNLERFVPPSRWHWNTEAGAMCLLPLCVKEEGIHHHYEICQLNISSQIGQQIGGNERRALKG